MSPPRRPSGGGDEEPLRLVHHHPGRLRVRAERLRAREGSEALLRALDAQPGVLRAEANLVAGSVLVLYEPAQTGADELLERAAREAGFAGVHAELPTAQPLGGVVTRAVGALNEVTGELTGGRADLRELVPAALFVAAGYAIAKGKGERLPRWDNLLWWSYSVFVDFQRRREGPR